ncbi:UvrD-helicase domain-containing protein [Mycolicibacterium komossense]|uniref:RecBCD enzyme subunit RecB n=1 Tax=Mycolicibacterium komossense TaxID=1779 RepID=A0ABT3CI15_9MYCO|nr:UvrD-helicase domain-containing protein [Mycolicibacterium komossense]MCV7229140.1 UvrD-helicase domain-containing protein [Mycolicibacterium komossense]
MDRFNLLGPLPAPGSTTVLEASAGTGKTFVLAGLVTRYLADGAATLDDMLLITFSRAATAELRERVRHQIVEAVAAFGVGSPPEGNELIDYLLSGTDADRAARHTRLRDALAEFDAATITTTHEFCQLVLKSLGVAGDSDAGVTLVEDLGDLVREIVDDVYLRRFGGRPEVPVFDRAAALALANAVVDKAGTELRPIDPPTGTMAAERIGFARDVLAEMDIRKRRLGILHFDDLLSRLAEALEPEDSPARVRMRSRWSIVMIDEFQDTDPVQWQVVDRAFRGHSTLILIGDPKQAIYAFRGGDIDAYLDAARTAGTRFTLGTNWRSDSALVHSLHSVLGGAALGDPAIVVHDVDAAHQGHRLAGAPRNVPFRLRVVDRAMMGYQRTQSIPIDEVRAHIARDLAADIAGTLAADVTFGDRALGAGDIAVIVESHADARRCYDALVAVGVPAVYTGDSNIFSSAAAAEWLCLLDGFDQTHRSTLVRAVATTAFFGYTVEEVVRQGDSLTDAVADTLRQWADYARERGVAAVFEVANVAGMSRRILADRGGQRLMTDLAHIGQLLQEVAHRERLGVPALRDWLRERCIEQRRAERNRRLDSDAAGVQVMTVWASKGLQYPIVYLPFNFNRYVGGSEVISYHDARGRRCLHIGGQTAVDFDDAARAGRTEDARERLRLAYVALTRAQSQVVAWWAPTKDEINGGLSRLLRGRARGDADVLDECRRGITDADALACFEAWSAEGGPVIERAVTGEVPEVPAVSPPTGLAVRHFHRGIDTRWRRTSYSGLIRAAGSTGSAVIEAASPGVTSEPETAGKDDEVEDVPVPAAPDSPGAQVESPMSNLPGGTDFGSLVHAVLETADPAAADLTAELAEQIRRHAGWWSVAADPDELAAALLAVHDTPLGPLAPGLTLRDIAQRDRLRELDFEIPLAGGDLADQSATETTLADVGELLRRHLPADDPLAGYADRLVGPVLGSQSLRGYLTGSIDVVLRIPDGTAHRYVVVDYKTNRLGEPGRPLSAADYGPPQLAQAMLHSDYPLQALLYCVVLHRFLRWRQPGYRPAVHLGGVQYLFLRGMCGPATPLTDGHPAGVFSWQPPAALVTALSDLLDEGVR